MKLARPVAILISASSLVLAALVASPSAIAAPATTIGVGTMPTTVTFTPDGKKALVANEGSRSVSIIDVATSSVVRTVAVARTPRDIAVTPDGVHAWVVGWDPGALDSVQIITIATGAVVNVDVFTGSPSSVEFSSGGQLAWILGINGQLTFIDTATRASAGHVEVPIDAHDLLMAPNGRIAYVTGGLGSWPGEYTGIDTATRQVVSQGGYGSHRAKAAMTPDSSKILSLVSYGQLKISGTDDANPQYISGFDDQASAVAVTPVGSHAYVTNTGDGTVSVVDLGNQSIIETIPVGLRPRGVQVSPDGTKVFVANSGDDTVSVITRADRTVSADLTERLSGIDRYATAVKISEEGYPSEVGTLWIATGQNYPDALAAAAAAASQQAPLLLVSRDTIPPVVLTEIARLSPEQIVIVGGLPTIGSAVRTQLRALAPQPLVELAGATRYETADLIVRYAFEANPPERVFIATGANFADALSAGGAAGAERAPVMLVPGTSETWNPQIIDLLSDLGVKEAVAVGGQPSLRWQFFYWLGDYYSSEFSYERFSGPNRYITSQNLNGASFDTADVVYLATGEDFPDALAGAALAGAQGAPLYIVPPTCVPKRVLNDLARLGPERIVLLGGTPTLSTAVEQLVPCA
ncbi:YVTN family beta-propeller protein [Leifsonia sp. AK011]|uniref:cell wall-binding repeat-containing protein n=1 Tax=Leifsonia sp. AK011 TaxID=2723075 RepID=UPI0015CB9174|nr:cell wall-binding repeat-containing protein [Leifsonia sp. AK011]NYF11481.1 YVTN family beta-propeller protein [Leifsonia sp. AK011]